MTAVDAGEQLIAGVAAHRGIARLTRTWHNISQRCHQDEQQSCCGAVLNHEQHPSVESPCRNDVLPFPLVSSDNSKRPARCVLEKMSGCDCDAESPRHIRYRTKNRNCTTPPMGGHNDFDSDHNVSGPLDNACCQYGGATEHHSESPKLSRSQLMI